MPDSNGGEGGLGHRRQSRTALVDAHVGEGRDQRADRILELERAFLQEHHRRDRRDRLRHRVDAPHRVELDRQPRFPVTLAARREMHDAPVTGHEERPTGQAPIVDVSLEVAIDPRQSIGREARLARVDFGLQIRHDASRCGRHHPMTAPPRPDTHPTDARLYAGNSSQMRRKDESWRLQGR